MIQTKEHYITYFDVMGYRKLIEQDSLFLERINNAMISIMDNFKLTQDFLGLVLSKPDIRIKVFSDNVIIFVEVTGNKQIDMINLSTMFYCTKKIQLSLMHNASVFLRGAITKGQLYSNDIYIYGSGLVRAVDLEGEIAKYPRIIIDDSIINDLEHLDFNILEKADFLIDSLINNKIKYSKGVRKFLRLLDKNSQSGFFFDDIYYFGILDSLDECKTNKSINWDKIDFIILADKLKRFFLKNKASIIKTHDDIWFLDYLDNNCVKQIGLNTNFSLLTSYLEVDKQAYQVQTDLVKNYDNFVKIQSKYDWIKDYHNSIVEQIIWGVDDGIDLLIN